MKNLLENLTQFEFCPPGSVLDEPTVKWTFIALYVFVFMCCLIGNLLVILIILLRRDMRSATNFFLVNLAIADLLVAAFCVLQNMVQILVIDAWPLGSLLCHIYIFILHLVPCTSAGILMLVSIEKYIAVLHPLLARKVLTQKLRISSTVFTWIISIAASSPYYSAANYISYDTIAVCSRKMVSFRHYQTIFFFMWYMAPVAALAFLYCRIWLTLRQRAKSSIVASSRVSHRWRRPPNDRTCTKCKSIELGYLRSQGRSSCPRRPDVRLLLAIVLSFGLFTFPQHLRMLYYSWRLENSFNHCISSAVVLFQPLAYLALFLNSAINPFLFAFLSQRFRNSIRIAMGYGTRRRSERERLMLRTTVDKAEKTPLVRKRAYTFS